MYLFNEIKFPVLKRYVFSIIELINYKLSLGKKFLRSVPLLHFYKGFFTEGSWDISSPFLQN